MKSASHIPVLLNEAVQALVGEAMGVNGCFVDGTFGRGGHSRLILSHLSKESRLDVFDQDPVAIGDAARLAASDSRVHVHHDNFSKITDLPANSVAGMLLDLGVSSPQIDDGSRGFSFRMDGPLDMRMNNQAGQSVADWLAYAAEGDIAQVIKEYGEERFSKGIAKAIVAHRQNEKIVTTLQLAQIVSEVVRTREVGQHPATRTFQAFRIFINRELDVLQDTLVSSLNLLQNGGRLVVISFHSLEDRIVKRFINQHSRDEFDRKDPFKAQPMMALKSIGRIRPSNDEIALNPRARSAIMRVAERVLPC